jgi:hypothetical protein
MTITRSQYLALRTEFHALLERAVKIGAQLPSAEQVDQLDDADPQWQGIELLLLEFNAVQAQLDAVMRHARTFQSMN